MKPAALVAVAVLVMFADRPAFNLAAAVLLLAVGLPYIVREVRS